MEENDDEASIASSATPKASTFPPPYTDQDSHVPPPSIIHIAIAGTFDDEGRLSSSLEDVRVFCAEGATGPLRRSLLDDAEMLKCARRIKAHIQSTSNRSCETGLGALFRDTLIDTAIDALGVELITLGQMTGSRWEMTVPEVKGTMEEAIMRTTDLIIRARRLMFSNVASVADCCLSMG